MGRPSRIEVSAEAAQVTIGSSAVAVMQGQLLYTIGAVSLAFCCQRRGVLRPRLGIIISCSNIELAHPPQRVFAIPRRAIKMSVAAGVKRSTIWILASASADSKTS